MASNSEPPEEVLEGGFTNTVVRVGDTVRRSAGAWTPTIHRLLCHVRARGVHWVPEPRGHDERGREVLSYVEGVVPHAMPTWIWSDAVLYDVARALRQWHDASVDFDRAGAIWNQPHGPTTEVICHNDFAPYNCVFEGQRFVGAIDFDTCSPGSRLWDLAYAAYRFVPLLPPPEANVADGHQERSPFDERTMRRRLQAFCRDYAAADPELAPTRPELIEMADARLRGLASWTGNHFRKTGNEALKDHARMYRAHADWLASGGLCPDGATPPELR